MFSSNDAPTRWSVEQEFDQILEAVLNPEKSYQEKVDVCLKFHLYGEMTAHIIQDKYSQIDQIPTKIWLDALIMLCGEEPLTNWQAKIEDSSDYNQDFMPIYLESLTVVGNEKSCKQSRRILIDLYRFSKSQKVCLQVLGNMAKLGPVWIEKVFIDQMLVQDEREFVAEMIFKLIKDDPEFYELTRQAFHIVINKSKKRGIIARAIKYLARIDDSYVNNKVRELIAEGRFIPAAAEFLYQQNNNS
jgi:hypothetical protein